MAPPRKSAVRVAAGAETPSIPRYQDLAAEIAAQIEAGTHPVGSQLPSEHELCEQYGVSRFTIRAALDSLRRKGYVTRRPKVGTVVIADHPSSRYSISVVGTADLLRFSREMKYRLLESSEVTADLALSRELECVEGESWIVVRGCRVTPQTGLVVSLADYYVRPEFSRIFGGMSARKTHQTPIYARIEHAAREPVTEIRQEITAHTLRADQAKTLGVPEGAVAFRMVHRMFGADSSRPVYAVVSVYPAERFSFTQTLKLET